jgi:hypothetical protein
MKAMLRNGLLRVRCQRPGQRTTQKRDKIAPSHCSPPPPAFPDYSKEKRPTEWGYMVGLHRNNAEPPMSQMGQNR